METGMMFLDCPAYMDKHGAIRCGFPAEVERRYTVQSTDGLLESAKIRCPRGHWFNGPVEYLIWDKHSDAAGSEGRYTGLMERDRSRISRRANSRRSARL